MAKRLEVWEYGELTLVGVLRKGTDEAVTNYSARLGGREPLHGTDVHQLAVMNSFGAQGWRLKLINEMVAPDDSASAAELFSALARVEELTGTPGTVQSVTRFAMARRVK